MHHWIDKQPKFAKKMKMAQRSVLLVPLLLMIVLIGFIGFTTLFLGGGNDSWRLLGTLAIFVLLVVPMRALVMRSTESYTDYDLGVENKHLIVRHIKSDKKTIILSNHIEYTQYAFCAGEFYFPYQHHQLGSAYNPQQFKQYVAPLFKQGSKITEWEMFTRLLRSKKYDPR